MRTLKNISLVLLFILLTLLLYLVFFVTVPVFRDPHGLLVMNELPVPSQSTLIKELLFGSAVVCVLLGSLMMNWVPPLKALILGLFWALTYGYVWLDTILALWIQTHEKDYAFVFLMGLLFIGLLFFILDYFGFPETKSEASSFRGSEVVHAWLWGWICFYFGLSGRLIFNSFFYSAYHFPLALGALVVCFLNYLLYLHIKRTEGKEIGPLSKIGRLVFTVWMVLLLVLWIYYQWIV